MALTAALLAGCGGSKPGTTGSSHGGGSKKADTLSEYLSKEKSIAYIVENMDKSETPEDIYFFEDGRLTILPGEAFDMTLGEFAQMEDKEIWKKYAMVKEEYRDSYIAGKENEIINKVENDIEKEAGMAVQAVAELQSAKEEGYMNVWDFMPYVESYIYEEGGMEQYPMEAIEEVFRNPEESTWTQEVAESALSCYQVKLNAARAKETEFRKQYAYKGPFFDVPFYFVVESDSSGNSVQKEYLLNATQQDPIKNFPGTYYDMLTFANVGGADRMIYDTTYHCFGLDGKHTFCTKDAIRLDTVDSKGVLLDLPEKEWNNLFKNEVPARYGYSDEELVDMQSTEF